MIRLLLVFIGYLFGLFQTGYFYGNRKGVDLKKKGSGNTGATNTLRVMGLKSALIVFAGDFLKAFIPCFFVHLIFRGRGEETASAYLAYTAFGVILGTDFPFYLKFQGGKGVGATAGWEAAGSFTVFLTGFVIFFAIAFLTGYVSLASIVVAFLTILFAFLYGKFCFAEPFSAPAAEYYILVILMAALLIWRHRGNIKRLLNGTENRFGKKKEKK